MKFGRVRDRLLDDNVHASTPDSVKSIYSEGWHELEDNNIEIDNNTSALRLAGACFT